MQGDLIKRELVVVTRERGLYWLVPQALLVGERESERFVSAPSQSVSFVMKPQREGEVFVSHTPARVGVV